MCEIAGKDAVGAGKTVKNKTLTKIVIFLVLVSLSACSTIADFLAEDTPPPVISTPTPAPTPTQGTLGVDAPITLKLWVSPEFDPSTETEAAAILRARLDEYSQLHPGVRVDTRVKGTTGPASLIESLSSAISAAPLALPDLVLLSTDDAQIAAKRNLIYPLQSETDFSLENDWYQYAEGLTLNQDQTFGIPFALDAMVMVYRPSQTENPPVTWSEFLELGQRLMFPAASPQALFTILLYLSEGGQITNEDGNLSLAAGALERVLSFYSQAQASNLTPYWLTQLEDEQIVWEYFLENRTELAVTWMSQYLQEAPEHIAAGLIPTQTGATFTLAKGWVWSVATPNAERQAAAEELAFFLSEPDFIGSWTQSLGYLPVHPSALAAWEAGPEQSLASVILPSAVPSPDYTDLSILGPAFQQAANAILKQELTISEAASGAINQLQN
jgi:ABC-type glycerol-3-phosphate transport system substrate-binding protein